MEVTLQGVNAIKLRGKNASLFINPNDKSATYNAAILLANPSVSSLKIHEDAVVIDGPGEYETGGIKISGIRANGQTAYSMSIDGVDIIVGDIKTLDAIHQKVKEHNMAVIYTPEEVDAAFVSSLAAHAILFFGEKSKEVIDSLAKEETKVASKCQVTAQKLPAETETILLASS